MIASRGAQHPGPGPPFPVQWGPHHPTWLLLCLCLPRGAPCTHTSGSPTASQGIVNPRQHKQTNSPLHLFHRAPNLIRFSSFPPVLGQSLLKTVENSFAPAVRKRLSPVRKIIKPSSHIRGNESPFFIQFAGRLFSSALAKEVQTKFEQLPSGSCLPCRAPSLFLSPETPFLLERCRGDSSLWACPALPGSSALGSWLWVTESPLLLLFLRCDSQVAALQVTWKVSPVRELYTVPVATGTDDHNCVSSTAAFMPSQLRRPESRIKAGPCSLRRLQGRVLPGLSHLLWFRQSLTCTHIIPTSASIITGLPLSVSLCVRSPWPFSVPVVGFRTHLNPG